MPIPRGNTEPTRRKEKGVQPRAIARQSPEGWDVWGNEVDCSVSLTNELNPRKEVSHGICSGPEGPDKS